MTAEPHKSAFETGAATPLALARNDWLDWFSRLEVAVIRCGNRFCAEPPSRGTPLCQRLKEFLALQKSPVCPAETLKKLQKLALQCLKLLPKRATIVHSTMRMGRREGADAALFQNSFDVADDTLLFVIMTEEDFVADRRVLQSLTDQFNNLLANPSAPPRPMPAEAAGP